MSEADTSDVRLRNAEYIRSLATSDDNSKSPIDLNISTMNIIELNLLEWTGFDIAPRKLKMSNTGYTVILSAKWQNGSPYISGGPLAGKYMFAQVHFHWGENEMEGSEHSVDNSRMPMELHAVHFKDEYNNLDAALRNTDGVTVAVYFFKLQDEPNPFIEEIVKNLNSIQEAHSSIRIVPRPLAEIMRPFTEDYFLYWGPIVTAQNVHNVLWLIAREPIGITARQIAEFRKLNDDGHHPVLSNLRPLQTGERRNVFHVCRSGSLYASLLPLPRDSIATQGTTTDDTQ